MTQFSDDFKTNVNKLNADEAVLICLEINHPFLLDTLRVVNDSVKLISNGETYLPMGFDFIHNKTCAVYLYMLPVTSTTILAFCHCVLSSIFKMLVSGILFILVVVTDFSVTVTVFLGMSSSSLTQCG